MPTTAKKKYKPKRNPGQTTVTINLPKSMRDDVLAAAKKTGRKRVKLWRSAMSYALAIGFDKIPVVK